MEAQPDFRDLLQEFNAAGVEYLIVGHYGDVSVNVLSKQDLISAKRAAGRHQDLADVEELEALSESSD